MIWLGGPIFVAATGLAALVGADEAARLLSPRGGWAARLAAPAMVLSAIAGPRLVVVVTGFIVFSVAALALARPGDDRAPSLPPDWTGQLAASLYVGIPLSVLILLRGQGGEAVTIGGSGLTMSRGAAWVLATFTTVWAVDSLAYGAGRLFGRRALWPRVSPKKTWEGAIAGIIAGVAVGMAWSAPLSLSPTGGLILGMGVAVGATLGDLLESALKRHAGIKDSGGLFPGHGGMLDRLDSVGFAAIVVFLISIVQAGF